MPSSLSGESEDIKVIQQKLDEALLELSELKARVEIRQAMEEFRISENDLNQYLLDCGLSKRAAQKLTPDLKGILDDQIHLLIFGDR